jgi:hypothetical protein
MTMSDLQSKLQKALELAAEYDMLGSLAGDAVKRADYRKLAAFHRNVADELRRELASQYRPEPAERPAATHVSGSGSTP